MNVIFTEISSTVIILNETHPSDTAQLRPSSENHNDNTTT
jgi:hypothetical protein